MYRKDVTKVISYSLSFVSMYPCSPWRSTASLSDVHKALISRDILKISQHINYNPPHVPLQKCRTFSPVRPGAPLDPMVPLSPCKEKVGIYNSYAIILVCEWWSLMQAMACCKNINLVN